MNLLGKQSKYLQQIEVITLDNCYFFSIIVPIYNVSLFLDDCISSVLQQTFLDYELLLVDDGSTDCSLEICEKYASQDSRVRVFHKSNGGLVSARKYGLEKATGKYIVYLDGDDYLDGDCLHSFYNAIATNYPDIVCCNYYKAFRNKKEKIAIKKYPDCWTKENVIGTIFPSLIQDKNATYFPTSLWGKAIKREILFSSQMQVSDNISVGEDGACVIPCVCKSSSVVFIDQYLYCYRVNDSSMTRIRRPLSYSFPLLVFNHLSSVVDTSKFNFEEQLYRKTVHDLFNVSVSQFYSDERFSKVKKLIKKELLESTFASAINKAKFEGSIRAKFMHLSLKHGWFFALWLYSKIWRK